MEVSQGLRHRALVLSLMLVISGVGAAAGVTLSGSVTGEASTSVEQSVIVPPTEFSADDVTTENAVVSIDDGGKRFIVGTEAFQGETYDISVPIESRSDEELTVELRVRQVKGPSELNIDVLATGVDEFRDNANIEPVVQVSENTFRFKLPADARDRVQIQTGIPADASPGFYKIQGSIAPVGTINRANASGNQ